MLNNLQKEILDATFNFIFDPLLEDVSPQIGQVAIDAIFNNGIYKKNKTIFNKHEIISVIDQARGILQHKYPQNRREGSPYVRQKEGWVTWEPRGHNNGTATERKGLLSLTAYNDSQTQPVTRDDVIRYLKQTADKCKKAILASVQPPADETPAPIILRLPIDRVLTFTASVAQFIDCLQSELAHESYQDLDDQAHLTYGTTVINVMRKQKWQELLKDPENFGIPKDLLGFLSNYLNQYPILFSADEFSSIARSLESQYLTTTSDSVLGDSAEVASTSSSASTSNPMNVSSSLWSTPASTVGVDDVDEEIFVHAVVALVTALSDHLNNFKHLDQHAAQTYTVSLLSALRKDQLNDFLSHPENFTVPMPLKSIIEEQLRVYPALLAAKALSTKAKAIESQLQRNELKALRREFTTQPSP